MMGFVHLYFRYSAGKARERRQVGAVLGHALYRRCVFHAASCDEDIEGSVGPGFDFRPSVSRQGGACPGGRMGDRVRAMRSATSSD